MGDVCQGQVSHPRCPVRSHNDTDGSAARIVLTVVGIMRGKTASSGLPFAPSALQSALLLTVLVLHLGLMASPLHQQMLADDATAAVMSTTAPIGASALQVERADHGEHIGHCLIQWVNDAQRVGPAGLLAVVLTVATLELSRLVARMQPVARALGPPSTGDAQALLQVFRL